MVVDVLMLVQQGISEHIIATSSQDHRAKLFGKGSE